MSLENIFITSNRIVYNKDINNSGNEGLEKNVEFHESQASTDFPIDTINSIFKKYEYNLGSKINFILDSPFVTLRFFKLPIIPKSKLRSVLRFELASSTIFDLSEINFDYVISSQTENNIFLRVYIIQKELTLLVNKICTHNNLQLVNIIPYTEIIYISKVQEKEHFSYMYVCSEYENSKIFLIDDNTFKDLSIITHDIDDDVTNKTVFNDFLINRLNSRIKVLKLTYLDLKEIFININLDEKLYVNSDGFSLTNEEVSFNEDLIFQLDESLKNNELPNKDLKKIFKAKNYLLQSISLFKKDFFIAGGALLFFLTLIIGQFFTQFYLSKNKYENLEKELSITVFKNLPKGVSKSNALYILDKKYKDLFSKYEEQKKLIKKKYFVLSIFNTISSFKKSINTFSIQSLTISNHKISFTGKVEKYEKFEMLKDIIEEQYKTLFKIKFNQRTENDKISFQFFLTKIN